MREERNSSDEDPILEIIGEEVLQRRRAGEKPTVQEYCERYPEHAEELREFLPAMLAVEGLKPTSEEGSGTFGSTVQIEGRRAESIGEYRILREIGRGGMGVVFEAEQLSLGRRVALKVLPRSAAGNEKSLERFQLEARAAARMHHTNIVPVFEVGQDAEHVFYAMQLIQGEGLDRVIDDLKVLRTLSQEACKEYDSRSQHAPKSGGDLALSLVSGQFQHQRLWDDDDRPAESPAIGNGPAYTETEIAAGGSTASAVLPGQSELSSAEQDRNAYFRSVAQLGLQTARALAYAHARGIIHRDIKPSNLLLDTTGVVWVTDFGLAKTNDAALTHTGDILGTLRYMSPERFRGQCDVRADVYSVGLTLFELATLKPAFESPDRLKLIELVAKTEVNSPRSIDPRIPLDLETIILKASDKDPKRRYQSADDLAEDLHRFVNDEPILARQTTAIERLGRWTRRNPWLAAAMSIAALALVAVAGISTVAERTQRGLNEQLAQKQVDQQKLIQQQKELNEALVETNRDKEQLIQDLQRREAELSRNAAALVDKQADLVAEKGNLGEAMHLIAHSYALTDGEDKSRLAKLGLTAQRVPRLSREFSIPGKLALGISKDELEQIRPDGSFTTQGLALLRVAYAVQKGNSEKPLAPSNGTLLAVRRLAETKKLEMAQSLRFWDVDAGQWSGTTFAALPNLLTYTFNAESRLVALVTLVTPPASVDTAPALPAQSTEADQIFGRLEIRNLDSGERIMQSESRVEPSSMTSMRPILRFVNGGRQLIRVDGPFSEQNYRVQRIDCQSGDIEREYKLTLKPNGSLESRMLGSFSQFAAISSDACRLVVGSPTNSSGTSAPVDWYRGFIGCFDLETGEQVGSRLPYDANTPLIAADDASQIATVIGIGGERRIEIRNFESSNSVEHSIPLSTNVSSAVQLHSMSADRSRIIVSYTSREAALYLRPLGIISEPSTSLPHSAVQVLDVESGRPLTPLLAAGSFVLSAALSSDGRTLTVEDSEGIRVWELTPSTLHRVILPNLGPKSAPLNRSGLLSTGPDQSVIMLQLSEQRRITVWDGRTGRLIESHKLPESVDEQDLSLSPGGRFLVTAQPPSELADGKNPTTSPADSLRKVHVWTTAPPNPLECSIELRAGETVKAISPEGEWVAICGRAEQASVSLPSNADSSTQPNQGFQNSRIDSAITGETLEPNVSLELVHRLTGQRKKLPLPAESNGMLRDVARIEIEFSANGRSLQVRSGPFLQIGDLEAGANIRWRDVALPLDNPAGNQNGNPKARRALTVRALNHDATLMAEVINESVLQIRPVDSSQAISDLLPHPDEITAVSFSIDGRTVVTGCRDGLVRQWSLADDWTGTPLEIRQRVERQTGLELVDIETTRIKRFAPRGDVPAEWTNQTQPSQAGLDRNEDETLQIRARRDWAAATEAFNNWSRRHPDEWLPAILFAQVLAQQQKLEATRDLIGELARRVEGRTLAAWLDADLFGSSLSDVLNQFDEITAENASLVESIATLFLELPQTDTQRASQLFHLARVREFQCRFDEAVDLLDQATRLDPASTDITFYQARLMERLMRWDEALQSRMRMVELDPDNHFHQYRVLAHLLYDENLTSFWSNWRQMRDRWADTNVARIPERLAKPVIILGHTGDELDQELALAEAISPNWSDDLVGFDFQIKGLAAYRRGEAKLRDGDSETAREHFDEAMKRSAEASRLLLHFERKWYFAIALIKFQESMILHRQGKEAEALAAYWSGVDRHNYWKTYYRSTVNSNWVDWLYNEVLRREAQQLLGITEPPTEPHAPDSSSWETVFEDDFDRDEPGEPWLVQTGDWTIQEGTVRGECTGNPWQGLLRTELQLDRELPATCQIEYETWGTEHAVSELRMMEAVAPPADVDALTFGLAGIPHPTKLQMNLRQDGAYLTDFYQLDQLDLYQLHDGGNQVNFVPGKKYKVRVLQLPEQVTIFVDDGSGEVQRFHQRTSGSHGRVLRLAGFGEKGASVSFDNLKLLVPKTKTTDSQRP